MNYARQRELQFRYAAERPEKEMEVVCALVVLPINAFKVGNVFFSIVVKCRADIIESVRGLPRRAIQAIHPVHLYEMATRSELRR